MWGCVTFVNMAMGKYLLQRQSGAPCYEVCEGRRESVKGVNIALLIEGRRVCKGVNIALVIEDRRESVKELTLHCLLRIGERV